jgi:hypothetical protein
MNCPKCSQPIDDGAARFCPACGASLHPPAEAVGLEAVGATSPTWISSTATCPVHPGERATGLCARCGAFKCARCAPDGSDLCSACRARVGADAMFPLTRERWSLGELVDIAWQRFKVDWVMLSLGTLIMMGIVFGISTLGQVVLFAGAGIGAAAGEPAAIGVATGVATLLSTALQSVAQGVLQLGLVRMCVESLHGRRVDIGMLFGQFRKIGSAFLQWLAMLLAILIPIGAYGGLVALVIYLTGGFESSERTAIIGAVAVLLAVGPILYWLIPFSFAQMELACNDEAGAIDSIRNSFAIAQKNRLAILGVFLVGGLIISAGILLCCIGILPSFGLGQLVMVGLYLALRNGSGLEPLRLGERPGTAARQSV